MITFENTYHFDYIQSIQNVLDCEVKIKIY